jgi:hypothetical protein
VKLRLESSSVDPVKWTELAVLSFRHNCFMVSGTSSEKLEVEITGGLHE